MADTVTSPDLVLSHLDSLPTLPAVAIKLLHVTADEGAAAADLVALLRADQSLTTKILSVANAAGRGVRGTVTTLEKAVPLLGFSAVRSIVLAACVFDSFAKRGTDASAAFDRVEFWKHSLAVACAARRLAQVQRARDPEPELAFVAGLLHDLGKAALDALFPKAYQRIAAQANQTRGDIADSERTILGVDHTVAGRRLAERWRLPRELQETIWLHHLALDALPSTVAAPRLIGIVQLADTLVREQRIGYSGNYAFYDFPPALAERLGFEATDLASIAQTLAKDVVEQAELLSLDHETSEAIYVKAISRANTELGRLNTELLASNRRLAAGARYFRAIARFEQDLGDAGDPAALVVALADAAALALQRPRMAAFGVRAGGTVVNLAWVGASPEERGQATEGATPELASWLDQVRGSATGVVLPAPQAVRTLLLTALSAELGSAWLLPLFHQDELAGGLVYMSTADERARLAEELEELRSFLTCVALALGRANAQTAARRLSEDLAATNRRLQHMQAELLRTRTLSMIAEMAAGAGHELNSPLTVISGRAQMLAATLKDPEAARTLKTISDKAHECSGIVSELMDFARPRPAQLARVNLIEVLMEFHTEWLEHSGLAPSQFRLELEGAPGGAAAAELPLPADREQLKTVLWELLSNAADALPDEGGSIVLRCVPHPGEDTVELVVQDNGCGMPPAVLQRAFDPFYSHRRAGRGRGLGLPRAHRIIESHAGRIWLESRPDEGTMAHILLPCGRTQR